MECTKGRGVCEMSMFYTTNNEVTRARSTKDDQVDEVKCATGQEDGSTI
jgi:hypothetical protein